MSESDAVRKTIEASNTQGSDRTGKEKQDKPWRRSQSLRELSERARLNGAWIEDITPLTNGEGKISKGTENIIYLSKDGKK